MCRAGAAASNATEQRHLARGAFARELVGGLEHFGQLQHQARAVRAEPVERAGLGQRFQRAAVELAAVDALAEIEQVGERAGARAPRTIASQAPRPTPFTAPRP